MRRVTHAPELTNRVWDFVSGALDVADFVCEDSYVFPYESSCGRLYDGLSRNMGISDHCNGGIDITGSEETVAVTSLTRACGGRCHPKCDGRRRSCF